MTRVGCQGTIEVEIHQDGCGQVVAVEFNHVLLELQLTTDTESSQIQWTNCDRIVLDR